MIDTRGILIFQSDFGLLEGTVAQMYGVALQVDENLKMFDLSHNIDRFNTWDASYSLFQTAPAFPEGCVFVSVIDPGVGTGRRSVVALTGAGHYVVTPDNGTLTHLKKHAGIQEIREIDESVNRLKGSEKSHVFHGTRCLRIHRGPTGLPGDRFPRCRPATQSGGHRLPSYS